MIVSLHTVKKSSQGVFEKNLLRFKGEELYKHNVKVCADSDMIDEVFVLTDIDFDRDFFLDRKRRYLPLPPSRAVGNHGEAIRYGFSKICEELEGAPEFLVIMLGNSAARQEDVEMAIGKLKGDGDADSVCSVSRFNEHNPLRALKEQDGYLSSFFKGEEEVVSNERDALGDVYFFNGSFWIVRGSVVASQSGFVFPWMGEKVLPYFQDVHFELDEYWHYKFMTSGINNDRE